MEQIKNKSEDPITRAIYFLECEGYIVEAKAVEDMRKGLYELQDAIYNLSPVK